MGFGHRIYKNFDLRAKIIWKICEAVLAKLNIGDPMLKMAEEFEAAALKLCFPSPFPSHTGRDG